MRSDSLFLPNAMAEKPLKWGVLWVAARDVLVQCAAESGGGQGVEWVAQLESEYTGCDGRSEGDDVEREQGRWAAVLVNLVWFANGFIACSSESRTIEKKR